jgi:hypothetical protein
VHHLLESIQTDIRYRARKTDEVDSRQIAVCACISPITEAWIPASIHSSALVGVSATLAQEFSQAMTWAAEEARRIYAFTESGGVTDKRSLSFNRSRASAPCNLLAVASGAYRSARPRSETHLFEADEDAFSNSLASTPRAAASLAMLSIETFRSLRSIDPTYVRCSPARSARSSWEIPRSALRRRRLRAKICRSFGIVGFSGTRSASKLDDYTSTDLT